MTLQNAKGRIVVLSHANFYTIGVAINSDGRSTVAFFCSTQQGVTQENTYAQFTFSSPSSGDNSVTIELTNPLNNASYCSYSIL